MTNATDGVQMTLEQMRLYLQQYSGYPIALRQQGATKIACPYCGDEHEHGPEPGHYVAACDKREALIVIGTRSFIPNYGYQIISYRVRDDGNNELLDEAGGEEP
jgi:hypothetical protein